MLCPRKSRKKILWNFGIFFDSGSISCVVTSFYQIQLTWWKFYPYSPILSFGLANVTGFTPHSVYLNGSYKTKIIISVDTDQFSKPSGLYDFSTVWTCLHPLFLSRILLAPATTLKKVVFKHYCQFGRGILMMVGPKMQDFCPRIDMLKGNSLKTILQWIMVCQKVPKSYFQSQSFYFKNFTLHKIILYYFIFE